MDRGAWWTIVHWVAELDLIEARMHCFCCILILMHFAVAFFRLHVFGVY